MGLVAVDGEPVEVVIDGSPGFSLVLALVDVEGRGLAFGQRLQKAVPALGRVLR